MVPRTLSDGKQLRGNRVATRLLDPSIKMEASKVRSEIIPFLSCRPNSGLPAQTAKLVCDRRASTSLQLFEAQRWFLGAGRDETAPTADASHCAVMAGGFCARRYSFS